MSTSRMAAVCAAVLILGAALPSAAAKKQTEGPEAGLVQAAQKLQALSRTRDSLANLRWAVKRRAMDNRESFQVVYDRARDSLEAGSNRRSQLLADLESMRLASIDARPAGDPGKKIELFRQDLIDRAELLKDRVRFGLPWETEERTAAYTKLARGLEAYARVEEGVAPLFGAYRDEWRLSRSIERRSEKFARAGGEAANGTRLRVGFLGAYYSTDANQVGLLARSGPTEAPYAWHENVPPEVQRAILVGLESRELDLPVDPVQTQAAGPGYFLEEKASAWARIFDMQHGPLSKLALYVARSILILLVALGLAICFVAYRRTRLVKREEADVDSMRGALIQAVSHPHKAHEVADHADGRTVAGRLVKTGFENMELAPEALEQVMVAQESVEQRYLSKGMNFLGTVAANAAFIGLLGTVCGILDAFAHLGEGGEDAAQMVMAAIAEALIATAMGLAVAIPAVVFYNNLSHRVKKVVAEARELRHLILAFGLDAVARRSDDRGARQPAAEGVYGG